MRQGDATFNDCPFPFPTATWRCRVIRAVDGDTVVVKVDRGFFEDSTLEIRYYDIDTWERWHGSAEHRARGSNAWLDHAELVEGRWGLLHTRMDGDKYGRILGRLEVWREGTDGEGRLELVSDWLRALGHEKQPGV